MPYLSLTQWLDIEAIRNMCFYMELPTKTISNQWAGNFGTANKSTSQLIFVFIYPLQDWIAFSFDIT